MKTSQRNRWILLGLVWTATLGTAPGQVGDGGGGGAVGGGGGMSGNAGGSPPVTFHQRSSSQWGGRSSLLNLMADEGVQRELALTPAQKARVSSIFAEFRDLYAEHQRASLQRMRVPSPAGRASMDQIASMRKTAEGFDQEILSVLKPDQLETLAKASALDQAKASSPSSRKPAGSGAQAFAGTSASGSGITQTNVASNSGAYSSDGDPGSPLRVLKNPSVRQSLKLTPDQAGRIDDIMARWQQQQLQWSTEHFNRLTSSRPRPNPVPSAVSSMSPVAAETTSRLEALLQPAQRARVDQISLQVDGASALFRSNVIAALNLSPTQQARLASLSQATRKQVDSILAPPLAAMPTDPSGVPSMNPPNRAFQPGDLDRAEIIKQRGAQSMIAVLTPAQRKTFESMKGRPYPGLSQIPGFGGGVSMDMGSGLGSTP